MNPPDVGGPAPAPHRSLVVGNDDHATFAELYDTTISRVWAMAIRLLDSEAAAERFAEAVYAELASCWFARDSARRSTDGWVIAVAHRQLMAHTRQQGTSQVDDQVVPGPVARADIESNESDGMAASSLDGRADAALRTLHPPQRQALYLAYYSALTHTEIDVRLELTHGTTARRIRDALLQLRDTFAAA